MKKIINICFLLITVIILGTGCSKNSVDNQVDSFIQTRFKDRKVVEKNFKNAKEIFAIFKKDVFAQNLSKHLQKTITENGNRVTIRLVSDTEDKIKEQSEAIEEAIDCSAAAIIISPAHDSALIDDLKKAQDNGIKIITVDSSVNKQVASSKGLNMPTFLHIDNEKAFYDGVKTLSNKVKETCEVLMILGDQTTIPGQKRKIGGIRAISEMKNLKIAAMEDGKWGVKNGYNIAKKYLASNPKIKVIICANDQMALGASQYVQEAKLKGITITGFDALPDAKKAVKEGKLLYTIEQSSEDYGKKANEVVKKLMNGEKTQSDVIVETNIISK